MPAKLAELHAAGYRLVVFTNQGGIEKGKESLAAVEGKLEAVERAAGVPLDMLVCTGYNHFRKPSILVWEQFVAACNGGTEPDHAASFFCGDAAGRPKNWAPGKAKVVVQRDPGAVHC